MNINRYQAAMMALEQSKQAKPICRPNPAVGAVLIKNGRLLGVGHTQEVGREHAEVMAIQSVKHQNDLPGSELIVTLTPCSFQGRTPPCTDLILQSKISRVTILLEDPHPRVRSKELLESKGVKVSYLTRDFGECENFLELAWESFLLNLDYYKRIISQQPTLTLKYAMSLDGKMADYQHGSKWISGTESRKNTHLERSYHDAILIGGRTFNLDNPKLTVRLNPTADPNSKSRNPLPIIVMTQDRLPLTHHLVTEPRPVIFLVHQALPSLAEKIRRLNQKIVYSFPDANGHSWEQQPFLIELCRRFNLHSIYAEGGAELQAKLIHSGLADCISSYLAPVLFLGPRGRYPFTLSHGNNDEEIGTGHFPPRPLWKPISRQLGSDLWLRGIYEREAVEKLWNAVLPT